MLAVHSSCTVAELVCFKSFKKGLENMSTPENMSIPSCSVIANCGIRKLRVRSTFSVFLWLLGKWLEGC